MRTATLALAVAVTLGCPAVKAMAHTAGPQSIGNTEELARLQAQIAALQVQVEQLAARQQAPQAATPKEPTDGEKRVAALEKLVNRSRIGATAFFDVTHRDNTRNGSRTDDSGIGFDVRRFYLSFDHAFDQRWSMNLTSDFKYISSDGETNLFVKKAYLQGKFSPLATLRLGSANMAWIPLVEDWYGYRFVEGTLVDRQRMGTSADWGAHVHGGHGWINYQVSVVNGAGYKNPSRSSQVDVEARVGVQPTPGLIVALGTYHGKLGSDTHASPALRSARRGNAMVAWRHAGLRLGAEWFQADNWKTVARGDADRATGWSLWGSHDFGTVEAFARYDRARPSRRLDPTLTDSYWHAGLAMPLTKDIKLAFACKQGRLRNGASIDTRERECGVWGMAAY